MGLSTMLVNPVGLTSQTPSLPQVTTPELGQAETRSIPNRDVNRLNVSKSQPAKVLLPRIVDQANAQGNAWDTGVVPGCHWTEPNSTIAEEVKNVAVDRGFSRKAC